MRTIRVVIADDNAVVRKGIRRFLDKHAHISVVGEAQNGYEAIDCVDQLSPDVILLDMEMPELNGIGVIRELQDRESTVQVLVLSAYDDTQYIYGVLEFGVAGYLTKDESPDRIVEAVRRVADGERGFYSKRVVQKFP